MVRPIDMILSELPSYGVPMYLIDELEQAINEELKKARYEGYDKGYDDGYEEGHEEGYDEGYDDGYEDGYEKAKSELNN